MRSLSSGVQRMARQTAGCVDENVLAAFFEGRLGAAEKDEVARHLDSCLSCHRLSAALARQLGEPRASRGDPPLRLSLGSRLLPGQMFARYRIDRLLGSGGMGQVYEGYDSLLRRRVALNVLGSLSGSEV